MATTSKPVVTYQLNAQVTTQLPMYGPSMAQMALYKTVDRNSKLLRLTRRPINKTKEMHCTDASTNSSIKFDWRR